MAYDVETTMLTKPTGGFSAKTKRAIKSVNLMCYLKGNVTFNELYAQDFEDSLKKIIPRAKLINDPGHGLPSLRKGAYSSTFDITTLVVKALEDVAKIVHGKGVILGNLFKVEYTDTSSSEYKLTQRFRKLYNDARTTGGKNNLEHFCFPVIAFQERTVPLLRNGELESFLAVFGKQTMYSLFVTQRNQLEQSELDLLQQARNVHILTDATLKTSAKSSIILNIPASNGLQCNYATSSCFVSTLPDCFCNDANGACSAMSYP